MAFAFVVNGTNLNNSAPFRLESLTDIGGAPVTRLRRVSPTQQGATDVGYRVQPRQLALRLLFTADNHSALDSYRDTLLDLFVPERSVTLQATRDDGSVRYLDAYALDVAIDLAPEDRAARLHRVTVTLLASNPFWRGAVQHIGTPAFHGGTITNAGNVPAFADLALTGPVTNPVLTNSAGGSLNLTGLVLGTAQSAYILLRDGYKRIEDHRGSSLLGSVTATPVDLASFELAPLSNSFNGVNVISVIGSGTTTATRIEATWTNFYMSY